MYDPSRAIFHPNTFRVIFDDENTTISCEGGEQSFDVARYEAIVHLGKKSHSIVMCMTHLLHMTEHEVREVHKAMQ